MGGTSSKPKVRILSFFTSTSPRADSRAGRRPFRIVEIVQWSPYPIAIAQILNDPQVIEESAETDKKISSLELERFGPHASAPRRLILMMQLEVFERLGLARNGKILASAPHELGWEATSVGVLACPGSNAALTTFIFSQGKMKQNAPGSAADKLDDWDRRSLDIPMFEKGWRRRHEQSLTELESLRGFLACGISILLANT
eukprot:751231-Hanusia_phi.AAC.9